MMLRRFVRAMPALAVLILPGAGRAQAEDHAFRLTNHGSVVVREVRVRAVAAESWGEDLLGDEVLHDGQTMMVRLPLGQCANDIRLVFEDGRSVDWRNVDTCRLTDVTIAD